MTANKFFSFFLVLTVFTVSCTTTKHLSRVDSPSRLDEINQKFNHWVGKIYFKDGKMIKANEIRISKDSTSYKVLDTKQMIKKSNEKLDSIKFYNPRRFSTGQIVSLAGIPVGLLLVWQKNDGSVADNLVDFFSSVLVIGGGFIAFLITSGSMKYYKISFPICFTPKG